MEADHEHMLPQRMIAQHSTCQPPHMTLYLALSCGKFHHGGHCQLRLALCIRCCAATIFASIPLPYPPHCLHAASSSSKYNNTPNFLIHMPGSCYQIPDASSGLEILQHA